MHRSIVAVIASVSLMGMSAFQAGASEAGGCTQPLGGRMLSFDGTDDVCVIPVTPALVFADGVTLEAWVRPASVHRGGIAGRWGSGGAADSYILYLIDNIPTARIVRDGISGQTAVTAPDPLPAGDWSHVAMTYDGEDLALYVNGQPVASVAAAGVLGNPTTIDFRLGIEDIIFGTAFFFDGDMDEVRLWRVARTPAEILAWHDRGTIDEEADADLAGMWRLDEADGIQRVADASGGASFGVLGADHCDTSEDPARLASSAPLVDAADCNGNGASDHCDIEQGLSLDDDQNGLPDECRPYCPADLDFDLEIGLSDLLIVLSEWGGPCGVSDLDGGGTGISDLLTLLAAWGPCS